jgi:hypothetical protein
MDANYSNKKKNIFVSVQMLSLSVVLVGSIAIFVLVTEPKQILDDSGSDLIFEFRNINVTSHEISSSI